MNLIEVDQAARHAWPALEEQQLPFGVLRYAQGVNRRSNSLNVFPEALYNPGELIETAERYFRDKAQPSIVRILKLKGKSESAFESLDRQLEINGYELEAPSKLMVRELCRSSAPANTTGEEYLQACDFQQWLPFWHTFSDRSREELQVHESTLVKIKHPAKFLLLKNSDNQIVSCGMGVFSNQGLGVFGIATCEKNRKKGHGKRLIEGLIDWGLAEGARYAYLQVESANQGACQLYRKMGFRELYSYWYRVKKLN